MSPVKQAKKKANSRAVYFNVDADLFDAWTNTYPMGTKIGDALSDLIRKDLEKRTTLKG